MNKNKQSGKKETRAPEQKQVIGLRLSLIILFLCLSVISITTSAGLYISYQNQIKNLEKHTVETVKALFATLSEKQMLATLQAFREFRNVRIALKSRTDKPAKPLPLSATAENSIEVRVPLPTEAGKATAKQRYVILDVALQRTILLMQQQFWLILGIGMMTILSLLAFTPYVFRKLIADHLNLIARYARSLNAGIMQTPLTLKRGLKSARNIDELDTVVDAINDMHKSLTDSYFALQLSEHRFTDFADAASDWLWEMDEDLRYTYASERYYEISGRGPQDLLGLSQAEVLDAGETGITEYNIHLQALQNRRPFQDFTYGEISEDGSKKWYRLSGKPLFNDQGIFQGYRGTGRNITEEVRARQEAVESTHRFLDAIESVSDGIAFWDKNDLFVLCNRNYREQAGASAQVLVRGTPFETFLKHSLDLQLKEKPGEDYGALYRQKLEYHSNPPSAFETFREGRWILVRNNRSPDGMTVSVTTDITELKLREDELQKIIDAIPLWIGYVDHRQCCQINNQTFTKWFDLTPEDVHGKTLKQVMDDASYTKILPFVEQALDGETVNFETDQSFFKIKSKKNANHPAFIEMIFTPDVSDDGKVMGFFIAASDISERKQSQELLVQSQKMEAIGQLTGGVAHDFNNLLAVVLGSLSLMDEFIKDGTEKQLLSAALNACRRGSDLTQRLLAFGRRQALQAEVTNLNKLIRGMTELLRRTLGTQIEIVTQLSPKLPPAEIDRTQLESAVLNLAINARDAMPGGGKLIISTSIQEPPKTGLKQKPVPQDFIVIEIRDNGIGIDDNVLEHVIEPFFTTKEVGRGSGLGLSMVYGFITQSGGEITIASKVGKGTTIRLFLPASPTGPVIQQEKTREFDNLSGQGEHILIIEDDADVAATTEALLHNLGYTTTTAEDGKTALKAIKDNPDFDLVFSDVFLPGGMTGPDVAKIIRSKNKTIPILFTSGYPADHIENLQSNEGDAELISKPYEIFDLASRLRAMLKKSRSNDPQQE